MKLAFIYGKWGTNVHGGFDVDRLYRHRGLTGSESFFFNTIRGFAERGHDATGFADCTKDAMRSPLLGGGSIRKIQNCDVETARYDAVLSWNEPDYLRLAQPGVLRVCVQQVNDFHHADADYGKFVDLYVSPSESHREHISRTVGIAKDRIAVIPNSINLEVADATTDIERDPFRIVYCSSPDRGLHHLLSIFPMIRKQVPEANLRIYYQVRRWIRIMEGMKGAWHRGSALHSIASRARCVEEQLATFGECGENGITVMGQTNNYEMAAELRAASVLAYTCDPVFYTEGFSVSIMDACAAGCMPIISDADAIGEVYRDVAHVIKGRPQERRAEWVSSIVRGLTEPAFREPIVKRSRVFAEQNTRQIRAKQWEEVLQAHLVPSQPKYERVAANVL